MADDDGFLVVYLCVYTNAWETFSRMKHGIQVTEWLFQTLMITILVPTRH